MAKPKMKCLNCGKEFKSKRSDAKFCSSKCRKRYQRSRIRSVTKCDTSVTDKLSVTQETNRVKRLDSILTGELALTQDEKAMINFHESPDNVIEDGQREKDNILIRHLSIPNFGQPDCQCRHCRQMRNNGLFDKGYTLNHGPLKTISELGDKEFNRVTLPGDPDYEGAV